MSNETEPIPNHRRSHTRISRILRKRLCRNYVCNEYTSKKIKDILRSFETKMEDNSMHRELNIS